MVWARAPSISISTCARAKKKTNSRMATKRHVCGDGQTEGVATLSSEGQNGGPEHHVRGNRQIEGGAPFQQHGDGHGGSFDRLSLLPALDTR